MTPKDSPQLRREIFVSQTSLAFPIFLLRGSRCVFGIRIRIHNVAQCGSNLEHGAHLEGDAGVVDDAVVVDVRQGDAVRCYKQLNNITSCHIK